MDKKIVKKWSYSRYSQYKDCPAMYQWNYLMGKKRPPPSPAMARGLDIHKKAENFVNGKITGFPDVLKQFKPEFLQLRKEFKKKKGFCEPDISMNLDGTPATMETTDYFVGFADYAHYGDELTVIDYKTGRQYPGHQDQGHAYSTALLKMNPQYENINVEFWYLDSGAVKEFYHTQKDLTRMEGIWQRRIDKMYADKKFEKTPYQWCKSCNRHKRNGGDCSG